MNKFLSIFSQNSVTAKIFLFSVALFFLRLADGIIAFWAPNQIQDALGNSTWMGLVISFQSIVGLLSDVYLPGILRNTKAKTLLFGAVILLAITSFIFIGTTFMPFILLFLIAMAVWGLYYEFLHFAQFQFMGTNIPANLRTTGWGMINISASISYFLGPLFAAFLLMRGIYFTESVFLAILITGMFVASMLKVIHHPAPPEREHTGALTELTHWYRLGRVIWPAVIITILLGFMDSTFWTTGAVWSEKLAKENPIGSLFLPLYQLPAIFLGIVIAKWGVYKGKKYLTEKFLILSGFSLMLFAISANIYWLLSMVLVSAVSVGICYPLIESVYSDLISRMGHAKEDLIGLSASSLNIAYIIWPPIAGFFAEQIGERMSFSYLGLIVVLVSIGLLFTTPKKLRLPQSEIKNWSSLVDNTKD